MTKEEIESRLTAYPYWYHVIDLGHGIKTPLSDPTKVPVWEQNRAVRGGIDYRGKSVLDLGCADGMWSFEAEDLGATSVVACDISQPGYGERLMFAREIRGSNVFPYFGCRVDDLFTRLDSHFHYRMRGKFDIVQNLGLMYHVRDPLCVLLQIRKCIADNGVMLFETALWTLGGNDPVCLLNANNRIYHDGSTWWAPNYAALKAMLELSFFSVVEGSSKIIPQEGSADIARITLLAQAVNKSGHGEHFDAEIGFHIK